MLILGYLHPALNNRALQKKISYFQGNKSWETY